MKLIVALSLVAAAAPEEQTIESRQLGWGHGWGESSSGKSGKGSSGKSGKGSSGKSGKGSSDKSGKGSSGKSGKGSEEAVYKWVWVPGWGAGAHWGSGYAWGPHETPSALWGGTPSESWGGDDDDSSGGSSGKSGKGSGKSSKGSGKSSKGSSSKSSKSSEGPKYYWVWVPEHKPSWGGYGKPTNDKPTWGADDKPIVDKPTWGSDDEPGWAGWGYSGKSGKGSGKSGKGSGKYGKGSGKSGKGSSKSGKGSSSKSGKGSYGDDGSWGPVKGDDAWAAGNAWAGDSTVWGGYIESSNANWFGDVEVTWVGSDKGDDGWSGAGKEDEAWSGSDKSDDAWSGTWEKPGKKPSGKSRKGSSGKSGKGSSSKSGKGSSSKSGKGSSSKSGKGSSSKSGKGSSGDSWAADSWGSHTTDDWGSDVWAGGSSGKSSKGSSGKSGKGSSGKSGKGSSGKSSKGSPGKSDDTWSTNTPPPMGPPTLLLPTQGPEIQSPTLPSNQPNGLPGTASPTRVRQTSSPMTSPNGLPTTTPPTQRPETQSQSPALPSNQPNGLPGTASPTRVGQTTSPAAAPNSPPTTASPTQCMLDKATNLREELTKTVKSFEECSDKIKLLKVKVESFLEAIGRVDTLFGAIKNLNDVIDTLEDTARRVSVFTDKIPKIGAMIKTVRKTVDKFQKKIEQTVDPVVDKLNETKDVLRNITSILETGMNVTSSAAEVVREVQSPLTTAIACSQRFQCQFDEDINLLAGQVPLGPLSIVQDTLGFCPDAFGAILGIDIDLRVPDFGIIQEISGFLDRVVQWTNEFVRTVVGGVNYELCCNNVLRPLNDIVETIVNIFDFATCWISGISDNAITEGMNELFSEFDSLIGDDLNELFGDANVFLEELGNTSYNITKFEPTFTFSVDEVTCELSTTPGVDISLEVETDAHLLNSTTFERIELNGDDASSIVNSIVQSCSEALAAFTENEEIDCCDVARTCDPSHHIVLFEGNGCTQNIAGTLEFPSKEGNTTSIGAQDKLCLANDEARSVQFHGPLPKGTILEVADKPDLFDICSDDYSFIRLERELLDEEIICVDSFELSCISSATSPDWTRLTHTENGLDGRISQYRVTHPNARDQRSPECFNENVAFFEGNQCTQNIQGQFTFPINDSIGGCDLIPNDESRSVKLTGPIPKGARIDVADDCQDFCSDDSATIILTNDLPANQEVCVCTFEQSEVTQFYEIRNIRDNGLDGKVSYISMRNGDNDFPTC